MLRCATHYPTCWLGTSLDAADVCVDHAIDWEEMWSVTNTADTTPRGGANTRPTQQPCSVMLLWVEDKIKREIPGMNLLTIRMLLKAEQRTVSAILHSRSAAQTKEILIAAYRRAGLSFEHAPPTPEAQGDLREMTQSADGTGHNMLTDCQPTCSDAYQPRLPTLTGSCQSPERIAAGFANPE